MGKVKRKIGVDTTTVYTVYGTRINKEGDTEFFIYDDGYWFWEVADGFIPVE